MAIFLFFFACPPPGLRPFKKNIGISIFLREKKSKKAKKKIHSKTDTQVTEEQSCEEQVFPLAVNLLDRFLALEASVLQRCQLQLLGCVCLLTASKLRQCRPIGVDLLVYYTDYSVTSAQIRVSNVLLLLSILGIVFFIICWFCKLIFMTWYSFLKKNLCGPTFYIFCLITKNVHVWSFLLLGRLFFFVRY